MTDTIDLRRRARVAITEAFGKLHHGGGDRLYDGELADSYGLESPLTKRLAGLTYKQWTEIPDWALSECRCALSHFAPDDFRFHLPAYMLWTLDNFETSNSLSMDMTIYSLLPYPEDKHTHAHRLQRFAAFDDDQREAIRAFLRFAAVNDDHLDGVAAQDALDQYWEN